MLSLLSIDGCEIALATPDLPDLPSVSLPKENDCCIRKDVFIESSLVYIESKKTSTSTVGRKHTTRSNHVLVSAFDI